MASSATPTPRGQAQAAQVSARLQTHVSHTSPTRLLQEIATLALELQSMFVTSPLCIEKL
jgi:hypothetical protein